MATKKIYIVISDTGGGHRSVARAICGAIEERYSDSLEVKIVEFPRTNRAEKRGIIPVVYEISTRRFLPFYDFIWRISDQKQIVEGLSRLTYRSMRKQVHELLLSTDCDLVLAGNALFGHVFAKARQDLDVDIPVLVVVSDLATIHTGWSTPEADLTIVPTDLAKQRMIELGFPDEKVVQTGFPVHPRYLRDGQTKAAARQLLGLDPDRFTVLITGGGAGSGLLEYYVTQLREAFPEDHLLVVTASNKRGYQRLKIKFRQDTKLHLYQRVENMHDLFCASDVVITKAGPSTMMECLALDRPLIVTRGVGVQEAGNIEYMLRDPRVRSQRTGEGLISALHELKNENNTKFAAPQPFSEVYGKRAGSDKPVTCMEDERGLQDRRESYFYPDGAYQIAEILWHWAMRKRSTGETN